LKRDLSPSMSSAHGVRVRLAVCTLRHCDRPAPAAEPGNGPRTATPARRQRSVYTLPQITDEFEPSVWSGRSRGVVGGGKSPHARIDAYGPRRRTVTRARGPPRATPPVTPPDDRDAGNIIFFFTHSRSRNVFFVPSCTVFRGGGRRERSVKKKYHTVSAIYIKVPSSAAYTALYFIQLSSLQK